MLYVLHTQKNYEATIFSGPIIEHGLTYPAKSIEEAKSALEGLIKTNMATSGEIIELYLPEYRYKQLRNNHMTQDQIDAFIAENDAARKENLKRAKTVAECSKDENSHLSKLNHVLLTSVIGFFMPLRQNQESVVENAISNIQSRKKTP